MPARPANQHAQSATLELPVSAHAPDLGSPPRERAPSSALRPHAVHLEALSDLRARTPGRASSLRHDHGATEHVAGGTRAERAATWLSLACAVHCLLMPIAISVMPLLGASGVTQLGPVAENVLTLSVVASALAGVVWGYRRHRDIRVVYATGLGLAAYVVGHAPGHAFGEALAHSWYGMALAILGALTLAGSSFLSARLSHACTSAACTH